jgi:threonine synthase
MSVRFTSTRNADVDVDFLEAIEVGQPNDGGLFVPRAFPRISLGRADGLVPARPVLDGARRRTLQPAAIAERVLPGWIGPELVSDLDLQEIFSFPIIVERLAAGRFKNTEVLELFHGPTGSFKDFGARFLAACLALRSREVDRPRVVIVATSGDTGSAVADAFASKPGFGVAILYPEGRVSAVQEAQLTQPRPGVSSFAVEGSFDDCQKAAKSLLSKGTRRAVLISANSINVGRLLPQMLFYLDLSSPPAGSGRGRHYVVPCGNLGNLTAGLMAHASLDRTVHEIATFTAATNANDYFARYLEHADARPTGLRTTYSNAMDVAIPSNLERIRAMFDRADLAATVSAHSVSDEETLSVMRLVFDETGYVADPHTAVGLAASLRVGTDRPDRKGPLNSVIATADPAKYASLVETATGRPPDGGRFEIERRQPTRLIAPSDVPEAIDWVARKVESGD